VLYVDDEPDIRQIVQLSKQVFALWNGQPRCVCMDELDGRAQLALRVAELAVRFLQRTTIEAALLSDLLESEDVADPAVVEQLQYMTHRIHGSGATFGFSAVSECAGAIEHLVACLKARDVSREQAVGPQMLQRLRKWARRLTQELEAASAR
jgi:chemotaxis protein histidine kinase CheA